MKGKYWIPVVLIAHLISALLYLFFKDTTSIQVQSVWYFGGEALFYIWFIQLIKNKPLDWLQNQLIDVECGFIALRGLIYVVHDTELYTTKSAERAMWIIIYILATTLMIIISAWRHGFFKRTYQS